MGFTRAWFGHRSDRIPISRLRRTPFIVSSTVAIALLFGVACQLVLRLATSMEDSGGELALLMGLLILAFGDRHRDCRWWNSVFSLAAPRKPNGRGCMRLLGVGVRQCLCVGWLVWSVCRW